MVFGIRRGFTSSRRGIQLRLDRAEASVLAQMLHQLDGLVGPGAELPDGDDPFAGLLGPDDAERPQDPALLRLFPDGYLDDTEAADEFRRFTQSGLRSLKSERLATSLAVLARFGDDTDKVQAVDLTAAEAESFLTTSNDLRLVLGVRLDIVTDDQDVSQDWSDDDARQATFGAYQWLTWLQAGLLDAMASRNDF